MKPPARDVVARIDELLLRKRGISALHKTQLRRKRETIVEAKDAARANRFAESTSKWIDLVIRPDEARPRVANAEASLTAGQADRRAKGRWFSGHTSTVTLASGGLTLRTLDVAKRERALGSSEYLLVEGDLVVDGDLRLGRDTRSIYVVTGHLKARRIALGDAVLVVRGNVTCERVSGAPGEGIFKVLGTLTERRPSSAPR